MIELLSAWPKDEGVVKYSVMLQDGFGRIAVDKA